MTTIKSFVGGLKKIGFMIIAIIGITYITFMLPTRENIGNTPYKYVPIDSAAIERWYDTIESFQQN